MSAHSGWSDDDFIEACIRLKSTKEVAREMGIDPRNVIKRRNLLHERTGTYLSLDSRANKPKVVIPDKDPRTNVELERGVIIVGSDAHYLSGEDTTAHRAMVYLIKELKPEVVVMNGDSFDGSMVSRFAPIQWEDRPTVKEEMETVQDHLEEIANAYKNAKLIHTWGNHDMRFNSTLAHKAEQFRDIKGFAFEEHFPRWNFTMSIMVNENTMIKHRWHNGVHATWNNIVKSGRNFVTGHLHSLQVRPWTDYNGTRYAVDTGTLALPNGAQFAYAEDNPKNHRSGFAVLTFMDSKLMPPETCEVINEEEGICFFRGQQFAV